MDKIWKSSLWKNLLVLSILILVPSVSSSTVVAQEQQGSPLAIMHVTLDQSPDAFVQSGPFAKVKGAIEAGSMAGPRGALMPHYLPPARVLATIIVGCDVSELVNAITTANSNGEADVLVLASGCTYSLTAANQADPDGYGPVGLPPITSTLTIQGNGATIRRDSGTFRLFYVAASGALTLENLTLSNGRAQGFNGGDGAGGGGGGGSAGMGGAIFNRGALTIQQSTLNGHTAIGGSITTNGTAPGGGGGGGLGGNGGTNGTGNGGNGGGVNGGLGGTGTAGAPGNPGGEGGGGGGGTRNLNGVGGAGGAGGFGGGAGGGGFGVGETSGRGGNGGSGGFGGGGGGGAGGTLGGGTGGAGGFGGGNGSNGSGSPSYAGGNGGSGAGMGGALFNYAGTVNIVNTTLSNNTAQGGSGAQGYGGALFNYEGTVVITNTTFSSNTVTTEGGAVYNYQDSASATLTMSNVILANTANSDTDCYNRGGTVSSSNNLIEANSVGGNACGTPAVADDPLLGPLADNGGDTWTHALLSGSPAIDAVPVISCTVTTDQRGVTRPLGSACDIGSYELGTATDVSVVKQVSPQAANPGQAITYTVRFSNIGLDKVTGVVITDIVPISLTSTSIISSGVVLTQTPGSRYVWTAPELAQNQGGVITITGVLTKPLAAGIFTNTVTLAVSGTVETAVVPLTVQNVAPTADAGSDQQWGVNQTVALNGSGSDDNGDTLSYGWVRTGGPAVILSNPATPTPTFTTPDSAAVLTFTLTVTDTGNLTGTDTVVITVASTYLITPTAGAGGSITPDTPQVVEHGASITFTIAANTGYHIADVGVDGSSQGALTSYTFSNVTASHTISAAFALDTFVITPTAGAGGAITPGVPQTVPYSGTQGFAITPDTGYHILDVSVDGGSVGAVSAYTFTNVTANHTLTAAFALNCQPVQTPTFAFAPPAPLVGQTVTFTGIVAAGTTPITYTWSWGDESPDQQGLGNLAGLVVTHTFPITATRQTYTVTLMAANACSSSATFQQPVAVVPHAVYLPVVIQ